MRASQPKTFQLDLPVAATEAQWVRMMAEVTGTEPLILNPVRITTNLTDEEVETVTINPTPLNATTTPF